MNVDNINKIAEDNDCYVFINNNTSYGYYVRIVDKQGRFTGNIKKQNNKFFICDCIVSEKHREQGHFYKLIRILMKVAIAAGVNDNIYLQCKQSSGLCDFYKNKFYFMECSKDGGLVLMRRKINKMYVQHRICKSFNSQIIPINNGLKYITTQGVEIHINSPTIEVYLNEKSWYLKGENTPTFDRTLIRTYHRIGSLISWLQDDGVSYKRRASFIIPKDVTKEILKEIIELKKNLHNYE